MCTEVNTQTPVKQRPILFSTEMVRAILDRRKTKTRRVIKDELDERGLRWCNPQTGWEDWHGNQVRCPYGKAGDILWVREEHYRYGHWEPVPDVKTPTGRQKWAFIPDTGEVRYFDAPPENFRKGMHNADPGTPTWHKRLARFMPKDACRLLLKNTGTRFERLQDISEEDAISEGIKKVSNHNQWYNYLHPKNAVPAQMWVRGAVNSFETLWTSINGFESWQSNPWVWVVSFERIDKSGVAN